jgi:twitching motility protein PilT
MGLPTIPPGSSTAAVESVPSAPTPGSPGPSHAGPPTLREIVRTAIAHGASDVHIRSGAAPIIRVDGDLWPLDIPPLTPEQAEALVLSAMDTDRERREFEDDFECDFAYTAPGIGRFRANAYRARGGAAMVLRHVKEDIPTFADLGLPRVAHDLALKPSGLVLVCGPTGSGKTTTLAAMIDAINTERRCHILTIEDPIEFLHTNKAATISQRELHTDTRQFARALRSGMRQDPDVILVGEIRDAETLRTALQAAETGHLVLATLHARTVVDAINRVIDIFPVDEQRQARLSVAESLQGVMCQHLVRSADGKGRTLVLEIGVATPRVREAVGDPEKTGHLQDIVADGQFYGMRTFEQDAVRLVMSGQITVAEAEKVVGRPTDLHVALRRAGYREPGQPPA